MTQWSCYNVLTHWVSQPACPSIMVLLKVSETNCTAVDMAISITICRPHCHHSNLGYIPSSRYDPYPYQLSPCISPWSVFGTIHVGIPHLISYFSSMSHPRTFFLFQSHHCLTHFYSILRLVALIIFQYFLWFNY